MLCSRGAQNTADILAGYATSGIAARLADDYSLNGYADWFLPSKDELNEMYQNRFDLVGFSTDWYSSSSEDTSLVAWIQSFNTGEVSKTAIESVKCVVNLSRPVRSF